MAECFGCPGCGYLTLEEQSPGTYEICPVCYWEDDPVQFDDPTFPGGANVVSLEEARRNFAEHGVSDLRHKSKVRNPRSEEIPGFH